ncbi:MAG: polysulfide reductase NrfD [Acidobacteriota bacterium]|jgi:Fe-S-cluster-containing dehydrogenase component/formate-dependent nitrite reductase membrane component NrfD|nr:polysulfide reductase NrfD [Acidobacteriota bacterium]
MNYGFVIDNRKCIGCHACTVACKSEHDVPIGVNRTWVKYVEKGEFPDTRRLFNVMRCNHCADAPCVEICPTEALYTRKDGIVDFDDRRCISCKACTQACPYDSIYINPDTFVAQKCNYCSHRTDIGLEPACVVVCPEHAIISGDMDNPNTEISYLLARETTTVRKPEKGTNPKLFYIDGDRIALNPTATEVESDYMWSSQAAGVGKYAKYAEQRINESPVKEEFAKQKQQNFVQIEPRVKDKKKAKRVYDAPAKGVLWGWEVSAYILTKAIAAGAFLIPIIAGYQMFVPDLLKQIGAVVSFIFLAITGILLIMDLGRPDRFLYVLLRPQWKSWLSRGAYIITVYGGLLTTWLAASFLGYNEILKFIEPFAIVFALLSAVYTAFLFAQAKGRDFWQSPMLGVHMILHSLMAGLAIFLIANLFLENLNVGLIWILTVAAIAAIVFHLITLAIELTTTHTTDDAHKVVEMIISGQYSTAFWFGMIIIGNFIPLVVLLTLENYVALGICGIMIMIGLAFAQHIWVKAPQQIPLS